MDYLLTDIVIYPIKGLRGISVDEAVCEERGLQYDRRYLIIDDQGKFLSQRELPQMTLLSVSLSNGLLTIYDGDNSLSLKYGEYSKSKVYSKIWSHEVDAYIVSKIANQWLSKVLNINCRLVFMAANVVRRKSLIKSPSTTELSFADGYPYLILGSASMDNLNQKLKQKLSIDRFRANIILATEQPHEEDEWDHIYIGEVKFRIIKPCARCQVIAIDPITSIKGPEPTKTLASYRKSGNSLLFGANTICRTPGKTIKIGDKIKI